MSDDSPKASFWATWAPLILVVAGLLSGAVWFGSLSATIDQHTNQISALQSGPRGRSCENIVNNLLAAVRRSDQRAQREYERIAGEWGCSMMWASQRVGNNFSFGNDIEPQ